MEFHNRLAAESRLERTFQRFEDALDEVDSAGSELQQIVQEVLYGTTGTNWAA